jgi:hypothetical protein
VQLGIDVYAYTTLTGPDPGAVAVAVPRFIDRLQQVHPLLPLRLVPLHVKTYGVVVPRLQDVHRLALTVQQEAIAAWNAEVAHRFTAAERAIPMTSVSLRR